MKILSFTRPSRRKPMPLAAGVMAILAAAAMPALATDILWSSSGGSAWLTNANWTGNVLPTASDNAQFGANPSGTSGVGLSFSSATNAGTQTNGQRICGSSINGTFGSFNGVTTTLTEGSAFTFGSQVYDITYLASFAGNSATGGNDVALIAVPEPSVFASMALGTGLLMSYRRFRRTMRLGTQA